MKNSKLIIVGLLSLSGFAVSCEKYKSATPVTDKNVTSSSSVSTGLDAIPTAYPTASGFSIIQTPKPASGLIEAPPNEPNPYKTAPPYILGKPAPAFGSAGDSTSSSTPGVMSSISPGKISGAVYGYDINTKNYKILSNAKVIIGSDVINTDSAGNYTTNSTYTSAMDVSAVADGYLSSTVSSAIPGGSRNIHLQPIDSRPVYNTNTIKAEIYSLAAEEPRSATAFQSPSPSPSTQTSATPIPSTKYNSEISFGDNDGSKFVSNVINPTTGRIRLEVNPVGNKSVAQGQLFIYDLERDSFGNATNPTQMKKFIYKKDISFRVGDTEFPGIDLKATTPTTAEVTSTDNTEMLKRFFNINVKFNDSYGFSNFVCNAYVIFPTGEKVMVSRYTGAVPTNLSFRVPRMLDVDKVSYSIEAHAGSDTVGSDAVVNDLHEGDSVEVYLLTPPSSLTPNYDTLTSGLTPTFNWSTVAQAKSYQLDLESTDKFSTYGGWEAFTSNSSVTYPSLLPALKSNSQYSFQLMALDFNPGTLNILSESADKFRYRLIKNTGDMKFGVKLATHNTKTLPRGYRISYNTVLFRAK